MGDVNIDIPILFIFKVTTKESNVAPFFLYKTMIDKQKIEEAAKGHYDELPYENSGYSFKAGVEWAENQFDEIATEFLNWFEDVYLNERIDGTRKIKIPDDKLFQQFLKERNENK